MGICARVEGGTPALHTTLYPSTKTGLTFVVLYAIFKIRFVGHLSCLTSILRALLFVVTLANQR